MGSDFWLLAGIAVIIIAIAIGGNMQASTESCLKQKGIPQTTFLSVKCEFKQAK
jgi:hypothetical protein